MSDELAFAPHCDRLEVSHLKDLALGHIIPSFHNVVMRLVTLWREKLSVLLCLTKTNKSASSLEIYPETVYRDLARSEFKRSERSGHLCRILLVYHTNAQGLVIPLNSELASKTTSVLCMSVRDTDYVGWYRQDRILGVLLTTLHPDSANNGCSKLKTRLGERLCGVMGFTDDQSLKIRVLAPGELTAFNSSNHPAPFPVSKE